MISALTLAGVSSQSASGIPVGSALITGGLYLGCNRQSNCRQWFSRADVSRELSRPLNGYHDASVRIARFAEAAKLELVQEVEFYENKEAGLGARFLASIREVVSRAILYPLTSSLYRKMPAGCS